MASNIATMDFTGHENLICGALLIFVTPTKVSLKIGFALDRGRQPTAQAKGGLAALE
jgi:hypothetical protein